MGTWWFDEPALLGCSNPTDADLEQLRRDGFGVLISLLEEAQRSPGYDVDRAAALGFVRHSIPVRDCGAPTAEQLEQFVTLISALPPGARTVVHCEGGSGRTATVAAAYWVARGLSLPDAIEHVRKARRHAAETPEQEAALGEFAARRTRSS
jgi:atypical dual specificity phosphatase